MINGTTSLIDSIPIETKIIDPQNTNTTNGIINTINKVINTTNRIFKAKRVKRMYQQTRIQTHHCQNHNRANFIFRLIEITENPKARNTIQRKLFRNKRNRTHQIRRQAILVRTTSVTIGKRDTKRRAIEKMILSNYVTDNII